MEVLLAFMIFVIAFSLLSGTVYNVMKARMMLEENRTRDMDTRLVRQHVLQLTDRDEVEAGGDVETLAHESLNWNAEIETTPLLDLFKLTLRIEFPDADEEQTLFVLRPGWTEASDRSTLLEDARLRVENSRPTER